MKSIRNNPTILELQKRYHFLQKNIEKAENKYVHELKISKCQTCNMFNTEMFSIPLSNRHINCPTCKNGSPLFKAAQLNIQLENELDQFSKDVYAKAIFEELNKLKPNLLHNKTKKIYSWNEAFGNSFSENLKGFKYNQLINIFEGDIGPFHIID
jgi:hypothetical protein